jgi:hypothetical protein
MTVLVDTRQPTLQVEAAANAPGEVTVRWRAADANLDPASLRIEYRTNPKSGWRAVALGPARRADGHTTWHPDVERGTIELQALVSDVAGNRAVWSGHVVLPGPLTRAQGSLPMTADALAANRPRRDGSVAWSEAKREDAARKEPVNRWASQRQSPVEITRGNSRWMAQNKSGVPPRSGDPAMRNQRPTRQDAGASLPADDGADWQGVAARPRPQVIRPLPSPARAALPGPAVRSVKTSRMQLEYDDQLVTRSGGRVVQVWWTSDEGRTWRLLATDRDIRSPAEITVDGEGLFGFRVVALGARGKLGIPPQAGDQPEMMLAVDLTRPTVRILSARQSSAEVIDVQWQASDRRLAERPISLSYSVTPTGRRTSIADGIANTGHYPWRFDGRVPTPFYLHVEAKDAAGNVGQTTLRQPISLTRREQQGGAIRDVRPLGTSATRPQRYQFY